MGLIAVLALGAIFLRQKSRARHQHPAAPLHAAMHQDNLILLDGAGAGAAAVDAGNFPVAVNMQRDYAEPAANK
jgi:hypothetical protein